MGGQLRYRPGGVGVTARAAWASPPGRRGRHRQGGDAGVYTDRPKWPLRTVLERLCTLLGCCAVVDRREDAIVYTDRRKRPLSAVSGHLCTLLRLARCPVVTQGDAGGRRSVHRSPKMASRRRFGAFVYTVTTRVAIRIATRAASGGTSASAAMACRRHLLAGPSRLVGKTGSARAAAAAGWRFH